MAQYKTPDVYIQEKSTLPPSVAEVPTAIPVFAGYTEKTVNGKQETIVNQPMKIKNMAEYQTLFGGKSPESFTLKMPKDKEGFVEKTVDGNKVLPTHLLAHSVAHFFANGGGACYIVSTGGYDATADKSHFVDALASIAKVDEITLLCLVDAHSLSSLDYYGLQNKALNQCAALQDRFTLLDVVEEDTSTLVSTQIAKDAAKARGAITEDLMYGAAYYPYLLTSYSRYYDDSTVDVNAEVKVEMPVDASNPDGPTEMVWMFVSKPLGEWADANTAVYNNAKKILNTNFLTLPPTPSVAGVIAKTDATRGVWKAPANVALTMVQNPTKVVKSSDQDDLNVDAVSGKSINAIRQFTGKGNLVWGARTLAGNDNEWRYVSVRRLFNMVEESVQKATGFAVFEPNTPFTWLKLKTMIESYLENLWKQGALFGDSPGQAFFVNVGLGQTMTADDINNGIMHIEIGLAAVRPAEFIILTFSHKSLEG